MSNIPCEKCRKFTGYAGKDMVRCHGFELSGGFVTERTYLVPRPEDGCPRMMPEDEERKDALGSIPKAGNTGWQEGFPAGTQGRTGGRCRGDGPMRKRPSTFDEVLLICAILMPIAYMMIVAVGEMMNRI